MYALFLASCHVAQRLRAALVAPSQKEKPTPAGTSTDTKLAKAFHAKGLGSGVGTPVRLNAAVASERPSSDSGPISMKAPFSDEPPGPPWNHTMSGSSDALRALSASQ